MNNPQGYRYGYTCGVETQTASRTRTYVEKGNRRHFNAFEVYELHWFHESHRQGYNQGTMEFSRFRLR
jgi:hypothetical protein